MHMDYTEQEEKNDARRGKLKETIKKVECLQMCLCTPTSTTKGILPKITLTLAATL